MSADRLVTGVEVQEMIEAALRRHNRNATLVSMALGFMLLGFYANGVWRIVEKISPS